MTRQVRSDIKVNDGAKCNWAIQVPVRQNIHFTILLDLLAVPYPWEIFDNASSERNGQVHTIRRHNKPTAGGLVLVLNATHCQWLVNVFLHVKCRYIRRFWLVTLSHRSMICNTTRQSAEYPKCRLGEMSYVASLNFWNSEQGRVLWGSISLPKVLQKRLKFLGMNLFWMNLVPIEQRGLRGTSVCGSVWTSLLYPFFLVFSIAIDGSLLWIKDLEEPRNPHYLFAYILFIIWLTTGSISFTSNVILKWR